jgi:hypothetical protein
MEPVGVSKSKKRPLVLNSIENFDGNSDVASSNKVLRRLDNYSSQLQVQYWMFICIFTQKNKTAIWEIRINIVVVFIVLLNYNIFTPICLILSYLIFLANFMITVYFLIIHLLCSNRDLHNDKFCIVRLWLCEHTLWVNKVLKSANSNNGLISNGCSMIIITMYYYLGKELIPFVYRECQN